MWLSIQFNNLTWDELRAFVALGEGIDGDQEVLVEPDPNSFEPNGLMVQIDPSAVIRSGA